MLTRSLNLGALTTLALAIAACSGSSNGSNHAETTATASSSASTAPPEGPDDKLAPFPYTAKQLREACKTGRIITLLIEQPDKPAVKKRVRFMISDDERATLVSELIDQNGKTLGDPEQQTVTWEELRHHASYPRATTTIVDATAETPAGSFPCRRYTAIEPIEGGGERRTIACFAKELPGPPVEMTVEERGALVLSMSLLKNEPGSDP
ncbi:MAG: hypothetical protein U0271_46455 [Polyangiaceae bacterium]